MLKKLASPKKKRTQPQQQSSSVGGISEEPSSPRVATASDEVKGGQETEEGPQRASQLEAEAAACVEGDSTERGVAEGEQAKETPALERQKRRRSVLHGKAATPPDAANKAAVQKEGKEGEQMEGPQENQAVERGGAAEDAKGDPKRGFLQSIAQGTRGRQSLSPDPRETHPPKERSRPAKGKPRGSKKPAEGQPDGQQAAQPPSSSPRKTRLRKSESEGSRRGGLDANNADEGGSSTSSGSRRARPSAAPGAGHLSPIRRRPPAGAEASSRSPILTRQLAPLSQPEVHLIGEIVAGGGFPGVGSSDGLLCKWHVEFGSAWRHVAGHQLGQTQVAYASPGAGAACGRDERLAAVWAHPIDVHLATSAVQDWPKFVLQVWRVDAHMSTRAAGYGFAAVPFAAGEHALRVQLWRPTVGSWARRLGERLTGNTPELVTDDVVARAAVADRCRLETVATGSVSVRVGVLLRHFDSLAHS